MCPAGRMLLTTAIAVVSNLENGQIEKWVTWEQSISLARNEADVNLGN